MSFQLTTPCLLLERDRLRSNLRRLAHHIDNLGAVIRPHVKTHKSVDVLREIIAAGGTRGITVSTLREAAYFLAHGITDIFYAVGIAPGKFEAVSELLDKGCDLKLTVDNLEQAGLLADHAESTGARFKVFIELDTDGHRSGVNPLGDTLLDLAGLIATRPGLALQGVMTHAGESYSCRTPKALLAMARQERDLSVRAAGRLRAAGIDCPDVSVGSTPTAFAIDDLSGVTEVRAGVYTFFDLVMAGIGVCEINDIALSVLVSVIGHQKDKNWVITDGGWMALSRDRGTAGQEIDYGYGLVADRDGHPISDLIVSGTNQEHGIIGDRVSPDTFDASSLPVGTLLRILPNHACATAGQFDRFTVVEDGQVLGEWPRISGW